MLHPKTLNAERRASLLTLIQKYRTVAIARELGLSTTTLARLAAGIDCAPPFVALAERELDRLAREGKTEARAA